MRRFNQINYNLIQTDEDTIEYNSFRHINMFPKEIVEDTKNGAERIIAILESKKIIMK